MSAWHLISLAAAAPEHVLTVSVDPETATVTANDRWTPGADELTFALHAGLAPRVLTRGWTLEPSTEPAPPAEVPVEAWVLRRSRRRAPETVELAWGGPIDHPPEPAPKEHQRAFATSPGTIGAEGVVLSGASRWVPLVEDRLVTFELTVTGLPAGWEVVSQGERVLHDVAGTTWRATDPQEDVQLVAGPWLVTEEVWVRQDGSTVDLRAYLRQEDSELAARYLRATRDQLELYERLLPRYPYPSFAVVENWWDTGWGMPGFTLLGPQVMRFPWVLGSSYPHELLHGWFGNSAYVEGGNWCEGLTAYLADHLFAEQRGEGAVHRRALVQKLEDFVGEGSDFPLTAFGSRDSASSEAVGYGRAAMVFHMARRRTGDDVFLRAIGAFYEDARFRRASWDDLAAAFTAETGQDWTPYFRAWTERTGMPTLELAARADGGAVELTVRQTQAEEPWPLDVPVLVTVEGEPEPQEVVLSFDGATREATARLEVGGRALRADLDPSFDVLRRVHPSEVPPTLSSLLGEEPETFVLPSAASPEERDAWRALAEAWARPAAPVLALDDLGALPPGDVWVLGAGNRLAPRVLERAGVSAGPKAVELGGAPVTRADHSIVVVARGEAPGVDLGWVAADRTDAIPGLARKLPHYTRWSWLTFTGPEPTNVGKGQWTPEPGGPSVVLLVPEPPQLVIPERPALDAAR